jgi:hypothetical protein
VGDRGCSRRSLGSNGRNDDGFTVDSMQEGTKTRNERDALAAQLVELEMRYKRCGGQASCLMEPNFANRLELQFVA